MSKRKKYKVGKEANPQSNAIFWGRFSLWFVDKYGQEGVERLKARGARSTKGAKGSRRERGLVVTVKA